MKNKYVVHAVRYVTADKCPGLISRSYVVSEIMKTGVREVTRIKEDKNYKRIKECQGQCYEEYHEVVKKLELLRVYARIIELIYLYISRINIYVKLYISRINIYVYTSVR